MAKKLFEWDLDGSAPFVPEFDTDYADVNGMRERWKSDTDWEAHVSMILSDSTVLKTEAEEIKDRFIYEPDLVYRIIDMWIDFNWIYKDEVIPVKGEFPAYVSEVILPKLGQRHGKGANRPMFCEEDDLQFIYDLIEDFAIQYGQGYYDQFFGT